MSAAEEQQSGPYGTPQTVSAAGPAASGVPGFSGTPAGPAGYEIDPLEDNPRDEQGRRRWNVSATKIPHSQRDVARSVMPDAAAVVDRGFFAIGSESDTDDNDRRFPLGVVASYSLLLTDAEANRFAAASNAIGVALDRAVRLHNDVSAVAPSEAWNAAN